MLTGDGKWGAFYGCEAFILPSHQENFGISVVESLACGRPVLISDQVNIWNEIKEGGGGLVSSDSLEGVKDLLSKWKALTGEEKDQMSKRAKEIYIHNYAIAQAAKKLKDTLEN
jgi:glycosyltransferase involved in cell wall biosynthesis